MKNKCILFIAIFFSVVSYVKAAPDDKKVLKIGFVKLDYIMNLLPETKQVEVDLKTFEKQLMQQLTEKLTGLQNRALNLQKETKKELNNQQKAQQEAEMQQLQLEFEQLQTESRNAMTNKQVELISPIYEKIRSTIEIIAKENNFTHILNADTGGMSIVLYGDPVYNVSDLVLIKLGIDPKKALANQLAEMEKANQAKKEANKQSAPKMSAEKSKPMPKK